MGRALAHSNPHPCMYSHLSGSSFSVIKIISQTSVASINPPVDVAAPSSIIGLRFNGINIESMRSYLTAEKYNKLCPFPSCPCVYPHIVSLFNIVPTWLRFRYPYTVVALFYYILDSVATNQLDSDIFFMYPFVVSFPVRSYTSVLVLHRLVYPTFHFEVSRSVIFPFASLPVKKLPPNV